MIKAQRRMNRFTDIDLKNEKLSAIAGYWSYRPVSLEDALRPFLSEIEQLDRSIKAAKRYCHHPSEHGLNQDESATVYLYTMEGGENSFYLALNNVLRLKDRQAAKKWFPFLKLFDSALRKLPTVRRNLWRGITGNVSRNYCKGQILTWWSVSSCSLSIESIEQFLPSGSVSTLFLIEASNGKNISGYTAFSDEEEVLLGLGTELRVEGKLVRDAGNLHIIQLLELSDDNATPPLPTISSSSVAAGEWWMIFTRNAVARRDWFNWPWSTMFFPTLIF